MSQFALDTAVSKIEDNLWRGELCTGWRIGTVPNGGYVLAIAGRVLREALPHKDPLTVNAFYLAPTDLGPIDCNVEVLRRGGSTTFAEVKMYQGGALKVQVTAAYTTLSTLKGESWTSSPRPEYPAWDDCEQRKAGVIEFGQSVEIRLVEGGEVFSGGEPNGSGVFSGWCQLRDGTAPDVISLLMIADAFAPPVFTLFGPAGWVPTIELNVQVRAHPAPGPIQAKLCSRHLTRGVVEEDGLFWDSTGQLVAISRQTAKVRIG
jgi:acyl-CoA thioesterase